MIIFAVARDGKANFAASILTTGLKSLVLAPIIAADWNLQAMSIFMTLEVLGAVFIFSMGAAIVNYVRRLEHRLETRATENENLINKMPEGLLVF